MAAAEDDNTKALRSRNVLGSHENEAFSVFKELRDDGELLDVTLHVQGEEIKAHRVVLAACSPYFRAMLTTGFAETFMSTIPLHECDPVGVQSIVEYFYSKRLTITKENIEGLLSAASLFEIPSIVHECGEFIQGEIQIDNCLGIQSLAGQYSLSSLKSKVDDFVCWNFMKVACEDEYDMVPPDHLRDILSQDTLYVNGEEDVFEAVMAWFEYDQERVHKYPDIMSLVRFPVMDHKYLEEIYSDEDIMAVPTWNKIISDAVSNPLRRKAGKSRQSPKVLYLIGELYNEPIQMFNLETYSCTTVSRMKQNAGTAVVADGSLYMVVGGGLMVDRFNPRLNDWVRVADGSKESEFAACGGVGRMYLVGGGRRAKFLDLRTKEWTNLPLMSIRRNYHAITCVENKVFVTGGVTPPGEQAIADAECFNTELNKWESIPPMNHVRFRHELASAGNHVYAIGGCDKVGSAHKTVEVYDLKSCTWQLIGELNHPRRDFAVGVIQGMIFVFGGGGTTSIEQYNIDMDKWTIVGSLNKRWSNFRCVLYPFINFKL
ncbi:predicted protein [Nematostella vectensis]|uniref:BTB domain-containing protein n=1 Tax=Nematostella vectensis TaxID=45351 RepID=A7SZP9_NEMVE|nr:predicted protein [Nematostella vectensis]|eukprot:XP_001622928.1 predicted protein [Nematostella vectensis]